MLRYLCLARERAPFAKTFGVLVFIAARSPNLDQGHQTSAKAKRSGSHHSLGPGKAADAVAVLKLASPMSGAGTTACTDDEEPRQANHIA